MEYTAINIDYDTDGKNINLPKTIKINVPNELNCNNEISEYISDEISNVTGFCHKGFDVITETTKTIKGKDTYKKGYGVFHAWGEFKGEQISIFYAAKDVKNIIKKYKNNPNMFINVSMTNLNKDYIII